VKGVAISLERLGKRVSPEEWRIHRRGEAVEARYRWRNIPRAIPVLIGGEIRIARWGATKLDGVGLPRAGWTMTETIARGEWGAFGAEPCVIPCEHVLCGAVWYPTTVGVRGLCVEHEGNLWAYMEVSPGSKYYRAMSHEDFAPVLIGQQEYGNYGETA
jgi:hypothetical protein